MIKTKSYDHYIYLCVLLLIICFSYRNILLGKYIALWDTYDLEFTNILYLKDSFESGIFPYWNPFILAGEAFLSQAARFMIYKEDIIEHTNICMQK